MAQLTASTVLPPMDPREMLDVSRIASVAGELAGGRLSRRRPFRDPHHSASQAALTGGGQRARPGEMALAHNGVLFLDELPEFPPRVLEALRQPIEVGYIAIARADHHVTYPARFQLIAAMNPCRCGGPKDEAQRCRRGPRCAEDYQARISGPLLDRMDIRIELPAVRAIDLIQPAAKEASAVVAARVAKARQRQRQRFVALKADHLWTNAQADGELLEQLATPEEPGLALLKQAADAMQLSARGFHRVLRVARTLADLDGRERVSRLNIAEALAYRQRG